MTSFVITFSFFSRLYTSLFDDDKTAEQDSLKEGKRVPSDATTLIERSASRDCRRAEIEQKNKKRVNDILRILCRRIKLSTF